MRKGNIEVKVHHEKETGILSSAISQIYLNQKVFFKWSWSYCNLHLFTSSLVFPTRTDRLIAWSYVRIKPRLAAVLISQTKGYRRTLVPKSGCWAALQNTGYLWPYPVWGEHRLFAAIQISGEANIARTDAGDYWSRIKLENQEWRSCPGINHNFCLKVQVSTCSQRLELLKLKEFSHIYASIAKNELTLGLI